MNDGISRETAFVYSNFSLAILPAASYQWTPEFLGEKVFLR